MLDIRLVWDQKSARADWTIVDGQLAAESALESVVLLLLFTDRKAQPDYVPTDGTGNLRGWWGDTFQPALIGSRFYQLERRKITNRDALAAEAVVMGDEALQPMVTWGIATAVTVTAEVPPAAPGTSGTLPTLNIAVVEPSGRPRQFSYTIPVT